MAVSLRFVEFLALLEVSTEHSALLLDVVAYHLIETFGSVLELVMSRLLVELQ